MPSEPVLCSLPSTSGIYLIAFIRIFGYQLWDVGEGVSGFLFLAPRDSGSTYLPMSSWRDVAAHAMNFRVGLFEETLS